MSSLQERSKASLCTPIGLDANFTEKDITKLKERLSKASHLVRQLFSRFWITVPQKSVMEGKGLLEVLLVVKRIDGEHKVKDQLSMIIQSMNKPFPSISSISFVSDILDVFELSLLDRVNLLFAGFNQR